MKKSLFILALGFILAGTTAVKAADTVEQVCSTDSYGNTSCTTNTETTTEEVSYVTTETRTTEETPILNTSTPSVVPMLAAGLVALGGVSFFLKKKLS